jgi:hypothetical protein
VTTSSIVICPPAPGEREGVDLEELADELAVLTHTLGMRVLPIPPVAYVRDDDARTQRAHWVAALAVGISTAGLSAPVALVLIGSAGALAPAVGFSQRASRRAVSTYVFVDAEVPTIGGAHEDWPDAPVTYLYSSLAHELNVNQARLRGWNLVSLADAAPATISAAIATHVTTL